MTQGPDAEAITRFIVETYPDTIIATGYGATFFSCDPSNWPNFATITTTDENDTASDLSRPGVFRLNIGVSPDIFDRVAAGKGSPDYTALDVLMPHPVYAAQQWICVLNPSADTFDRAIKPLLAEAHERVASKTRARGAR